jgi:hypothetical protein
MNAMRRSTKKVTKIVVLITIFSIAWCNFLFAEGNVDAFMNLSPTATFTFGKLPSNTDAFSYGDSKFYVYSEPNNILVESYIEIYSVIQPDRFAPHNIIHIFPKKEYQDYEISNLIFVVVRETDVSSEERSVIQSNGISNFIVGYSENINKVVVLSLDGDLVNTIDVEINSKNDLLLSSSYGFSEGVFWLVDKKNNKIQLMNISGEIVLSFSATKGSNIEGIDSTQFEEVITSERGDLYIRDTSNRIYQYSQITESFLKSIFLEELKDDKIYGFAIDSLENIFISYHSVSDNKLKIAVIVQNEEGKYSTKVINEQPFVEEPINLLAHRGFLILVTKENYQIYETLPIIEKLQNIKDD